MTPRKLVSGTGGGKETGQNTLLLFEGATMVPMDTEDLSQRRPMTLIGQCVNMVETVLSCMHFQCQPFQRADLLQK